MTERHSGQTTRKKRSEASGINEVKKRSESARKGPLGSEYARSSIDELLLLDVCKSLIYDAVLDVLKFMTCSNQEISEDPILSEVRIWVDQSSEASDCFARVSRSLDQSGFDQLLRFSVGDKKSWAAKKDKADFISEMARRDSSMFFGEDPPIPGLPSILLSALFPEDERQHLDFLLNTSPSARRAFQMVKEGRSSSLSYASLLQVLPILTRMFEIFATTEPGKCTEESRREWARELSDLANRTQEGPRPTPIVKVLEARWRMDNEGEGQAQLVQIKKKKGGGNSDQ